MGLPNQFNDIIQDKLKVYAAWLPVTNNFTLGDYGVMSDGIFTKMGNIQEFGVTFISATGPDASLDFTSADTRVVKFAAGAEVDVIPAGTLNAKITFQFQRERSFLVKAPTIKVNEIQNVREVASDLKNSDGWQRNWKVVFQTYAAVDPVVVSTISAGTELTFSGDVGALKEFKLGDASVDMSSTHELGLNVHGKAGIIGLGLFKLKLFGGGPNILAIGENDAEFELVEPSPTENDL